MSAFKQEDMTEFGQLFNFDQAAAAQQAQNGKTVVSPRFPAQNAEGRYLATHQQTFQAPSRQYGLFKQQASLPPGAFQHAIPSSQPDHGFGMGSNTIPMFDNSNTDGGFNMDMDVGFGNLLESNHSLSFVDPSSMSTGSDEGDSSPVMQPHQRLWPGVHQQQAAKAQQEQQKKVEQQMRQRMMQQQMATQQVASEGQRRSSQGRNKSSDPVIEERITQILRQMRASTSSAHTAAGSSPQPTNSHSVKQKKDEEDMDEDERLLASEEGKKLSSKERRQLRNKVSARAFRSRRKEYISQLEGELTGKSSEADDLRADNEALRSENNQLSDLVRMLLGHPAFNSVLEDLSQRGGQLPILPSQNAQRHPSIPRAQTSQALAPQPTTTASAPMDFASTPMDGWNSGISPPNFEFNPNVFAVLELPEPTIDTDILSGKISDLSAPTPSLSAKSDVPVIERREKPASEAVVSATQEPSVEEPDSCPALFASESSSARTVATDADKEAGRRIFGAVPLEKASVRFELVSEDTPDTEAAREARFAAICEALDRAGERIEMATSSL